MGLDAKRATVPKRVELRALHAHRGSKGLSAWLVLFSVSVALGLAQSAEGRITKVVISSTESPTFGGASFGAAGQYEKLRGVVYGEVDPADPRNSVITDIALAPRNTLGKVEYTSDVLVLRPVDPAKGNGRVFYEINNRGTPYSLNMLNDAQSGGANPTTLADAGNGFLMREGYTLVFGGWDISAPPGAGRLTITAPVASNPDGSAIVGNSLDEFVIDNTTTASVTLSYPAADLEKGKASLTVRNRYSDTPVALPGTGWEYVTSQSIRLLPAGTMFANGSLYEFVYPAKNPIVAGLGLASVRDLAAFVRSATVDDSGTPNPLVKRAEKVYSFCFSQPCRLMREFVRLGFNQDEDGRQVLDAVLNWVGGASGGFFNYRFAQPFRTHRQHVGRWYPEAQFPFANNVISDPVTGKTDGILKKCEASSTCPKIFELNSANEYWAKTGSLLHTDPLGTVDLPEHPKVRTYLLSGLPHNAGTPAPVTSGICAQPRNPLVSNRIIRSMLGQLNNWATSDAEPPVSLIPKLSLNQLVPPLPQSGVGFPNIPGVSYSGLTHTGDLFDFGPAFESQGIWSVVPPQLLGTPYAILVPRTDEDGNELAGLRMVEVAVPTATYTGWNTRAGPASPDGCDASGMMISFPKTKAERLAAGDPRLSIEERYPTHSSYVDAVKKAAAKLSAQGFLLDEDVARYIEEAQRSSIGASFWLLPSTARTSGFGDAFWTTDVTVANTGSTEAKYTLKFLGHDADGRNGPEKSFTLGAGNSVTYADVLGQVFGVSTDYGALRLSTTSPSISLTSQTSTKSPSGGTLGQSVPGVPDSEFIKTGGTRSILAIRENESFRTNLVVVNASEIEIEVDVVLVGEAGTLLGSRRLKLPPLGMTQLERVARLLGVQGDLTGGRLTLSSPTPGAAFTTYAVAIDNKVNDPRTLLPR